MVINVITVKNHSNNTVYFTLLPTFAVMKYNDYTSCSDNTGCDIHELRDSGICAPWMTFSQYSEKPIWKLKTLSKWNKQDFMKPWASII